MGWGPQRVSGRVYETKPIIAVFFFLFFVSFKECSLKKQFLGAKSTSIRDCVGRSVRRSVRPSPTMRDYVEN
jgi:hypothetical protein